MEAINLEDALCDCNTSVEDEEPQPSRHPLSVCYVYPCYKYEFQPVEGEAQDVADARRHTEAAAHAYMVRMYSDHTQLMAAAASAEAGALQRARHTTPSSGLHHGRGVALGCPVAHLVRARAGPGRRAPAVGRFRADDG